MANVPQPQTPKPGPSRIEVIALALSVGWMVAVAIFFIVLPPSGDAASFDSLRFVLTLMAVFMPVAMIWVAVAAARSARVMREEAARLHAAIDGMRHTYMAERQGKPAGASLEPTVEKKLTEIAQATRKTETALATFTSSREAQKLLTERKVAPVDDQPTLALGTSADDIAPALINSDLIRALNFPDTEQDTRGFAALRRALKDRNARQLVQASQDLLTLLSQDGIYMDDLRPDRARPELWRRFARGERGRPMAALGGVRDRSSLALASGRMREDTIFRDAAHHFLRKFDQMLQSFEQVASDEEIAALSETRTARAFMLMGRVTGAFD
ncbi:hypothetical protein [Yoonia sp. 208BN28-4]|uniref:hypothetical protein n=1 Tax=Yoonia sp. 208BN28-4 TaxID=3126505 RepID=UPI00309846BE